MNTIAPAAPPDAPGPDLCAGIVDTEFLSALCEPVRVQLVRTLAASGRANIQAIAAGFPQDRSVISRHLQVLERAGIVVSTKVGRAQVFELDGPKIIERMEAMLERLRDTVPQCCHGPQSGGAA